jgi:hypothetical protein
VPGTTAHRERIEALQAQRAAERREPPSASPAAVFAEWLAASPENRMSALARNVANHPEIEFFKVISEDEQQRIFAQRRASAPQGRMSDGRSYDPLDSVGL